MVSDVGASWGLDLSAERWLFDWNSALTRYMPGRSTAGQVPVATPDEAADMVAEAIIARPKRIATRLGIAAEVLHLVAPRVTEVVMNTAYRMFPDSAAAKGGQGEAKPEAPPTKEAVMFASLLRGVHW